MRLRLRRLAPAALALVFLLAGVPGTTGDLLVAVAWASVDGAAEPAESEDEASDDSGGGGGNENVEEVVTTEKRPRSDGHSTSGGTGHAAPQLLGSASYDYYGSVQCPLSMMGAADMPGCSCPEGMVKKSANASYGTVVWCDVPTERKIEECEDVGGQWLDNWCHLPMDDHITAGCRCFINGEWKDRGETTYPHCMSLQDEAFKQNIFSVCQWSASW